MINVFSISNSVSKKVLINKSRFITFLFRVDCFGDVEKHINKLCSEYNDSTHICYAYILDNVKRFSDDGEPNGTAGMPILSVLENNNLNHVLCCVVRYFGGIKLGAGGLLRAYSNSCSNALGLCNIIELIPGKVCSISFFYDNTKVVDSFLSNFYITEKSYVDKVLYKFVVPLGIVNDISKDLSNYGDFCVLDDCYIEKPHQL